MKTKRQEKKDIAIDDNDLLYKVELYNDFTEPYSYGGDLSQIVTHRTHDEYIAHDFKTFCDVLDEFLDAPKKRLTDKDIRKDFDNAKRKLSNERVKVIKQYYNGRYDLANKVYASIAMAGLDHIEPGFPVVMKFNIPFHMNFFTCEDNDPYDKAVKMNDAYVSIEICKKH